MPIVLTVTLLFNFILGISFVIIPLYAYHMGLSGVSIGSLISIPYMIQIVSRFMGGSLSDRYGEKKMLIVAFSFFTLAGLILNQAADYYLLFIGQTAIVISRGLYWPVIQSLVSHIAKEVNISMGRLNACNNVGQISGTIVAGYLISQFGFGFGFSMFTIIGIFTIIVIGLRLPVREQTVVYDKANMFKDLSLSFRSRPICFAILCSFIGAQPYALGQSFYPVYLTEMGFSSESLGQLLSIRSIGGITTGLLLARFIKPLEGAWLIALYTCGIALSILFTPFVHHFISLSFIFFGLGLGSEVMSLYYQLIASESSETGYRASALVVAGMGWSFANVVTPFLFGIIVDFTNLIYAFYIWGGILLLLTLGMVPLHRFVFKKSDVFAKG